MRVVTTLLMVVALTGCPSASPQYSKPEALSVSELYVHHPSGMVFPVAAGEFKRGSINRYDAQELDVSVGYDLHQQTKAIAATVYVYPSPSIVSIGSPPAVVESARTTLCQNEYEARKREIVSVHPGAKLLSEAEVESPQSGAAAHGKSAIFEYEEVFAGVRQPLQSRLDLFCYVGEKWTVKYRFTYPASLDARSDLERFIRYLPWPLATFKTTTS